MRRVFRSDRRLLVGLVALVLLLPACAFFWLDPLSAGLPPDHPEALSAHGSDACQQFMHGGQSRRVEWLADRVRARFNPPAEVAIEARRPTQYGELVLYHVDCDAGPEGLFLYGYRLIGMGVDGSKTIVLDDLLPANVVSRPGAEPIELLAYHPSQLPSKDWMTTIVGGSNHPAARRVEARLANGDVVEAQVSERLFVFLIEGQHVPCEPRALDEDGRLLAQVDHDAPECRDG